jgi:hypothetical protein
MLYPNLSVLIEFLNSPYSKKNLKENFPRYFDKFFEASTTWLIHRVYVAITRHHPDLSTNLDYISNCQFDFGTQPDAPDLFTSSICDLIFNLLKFTFKDKNKILKKILDKFFEADP